MATYPDASTTFVELMALERLPGPEAAYMSLTPAWASGGRWNAFGGCVYAQAVWAAAQEVAKGMVVHSVHGLFTLPGAIDRPFIYTVATISEGRSFCTRSVQVRQPISPSENLRPFDLADGTKDMGNICFSCILSFKKDESSNSAHTELKDWNAEYGSAVKDINPTTFPQTPDVDTPWFYEYQREFEQGVTFPGLDIRKVDMREFNRGKPILQYRQLHYYRLTGNIPDDQPNLHAAAHCYASDRNSLFLITNALGFGNQVAKIASLTHSVVFHTDSRGLLLRGQEETERDNWAGWWVQEAWTPRSEGGRALHESKIWRLDGEESVHVATTMQDGLVRKAADEGRSMTGNKEAGMEENWKKSLL